MAEVLLIGSGNRGKAAELAGLLEGLPWEVRCLADYAPIPPPVEDGVTFEENALKKAAYFGNAFNVSCLADDSGLLVDALGGEPGIYSARYAGEAADDKANNAKLLAALEGVAEADRTARFVCCAAFVRPGEPPHVENGMVEGRIGFKPRGAGGFGYDPLFIPDGHTRTFGEMEAAEKKLISHRGRALHKMRGYLESQISNLKSQSAERIEEQIAVAAAAIGRGEVVVYPTETVYGLGADPFSEPALRRLYAIKERDAANPVLLVVDGLDQLRAVVREVSAAAEAYARRFWPGPLSMLFPKSPRLPKILTGGLEHVCVRWTSHPLARALCREAGHAITSTSANLAGQPPAQSLAEVRLDGLGAKVDGGLLPPSLPSTVFDPSTGRILREGAIPAEVLLGMGRDGVYT